MNGREAVVRALVALVAERGMEAVSVRQVAEAAGVSAGLVQHYFRTKQAMLLAAMDSVAGQVEARVRSAQADREPADALREIARQLVPLDDERATEGRVSLAFVAHAIADPELAAVYRETWQRLEDLLAQLIAAARGRETQTEDRVAAGLLLAVLDGLAVGGVAETGRLDRQRISALLDRQLDVVLGPVRRGGRPAGSAGG
ncbi:TetR/AcrR family transcriptional regulator [Actinokineospora sp. HUAS TT18]|uniref:TetR/AcrR family transcriptional regulator n=1 Tax=Actinokineospora sp. HUAS TT18 TaxID=3447451 RepID=UPI003F51CC31